MRMWTPFSKKLPKQNIVIEIKDYRSRIFQATFHIINGFYYLKINNELKRVHKVMPSFYSYLNY